MLHYAIDYGHFDIIKYLILNYAALFKVLDIEGRSPLCLAVSKNDLSMIIYILSCLNNLNTFSTGDIDKLNPLREKLVEHFIEGIKGKHDHEQKLIIIDAVLKKQNALGYFFHTPKNVFLYTIAFNSKTGSIEKIEAYRKELWREINRNNPESSVIVNQNPNHVIIKHVSV